MAVNLLLSTTCTFKEQSLESMAIIGIAVGVYDRIHKAVGVVHVLDKGDEMIQIMAAVAWACMMQKNIQQKERKPTDQK